MPSKPIPFWRKLLYATIPVAALLLLTELTLALVGVEPEIAIQDPFVGFSDQIPLFEEVWDSQETAWMATRSSKWVWFNHQVFTKRKAPATRRVFCMGGSTTYGRPFDDATSFCGWLRKLFPNLENRTGESTEDGIPTWEFINAGGVSYASYRVAALMEECAQFEPDLFIVYTGHNEFLEDRTYANVKQISPAWMKLQAGLGRFRIYSVMKRLWWQSPSQSSEGDRSGVETRADTVTNFTGSTAILAAEVDERLNHSIGPQDYHRDPEWVQNVEEHFSFNVRRMIHIARHAGAEIIFVLPAVNGKDCAPFKSEASLAKDDVLAPQFLADMNAGIQSRNEGRLNEAKSHFLAAIEIDPKHAGAQYELGQVLFELGEYDTAQQHFVQAIDEDVCPLRATSSIVNRLRRELDAESVPYVDFPQRLRGRSLERYGYSVLGQEFFLDHVHPTIESHGILACAIAEKMIGDDLLGTSELLAAAHTLDATGPKVDWQQEPWRSVYLRTAEQIEDEIDVRKQGVALRNLAKVMHWAGKFEEASYHASDAMELLVNDAESRFVLADCLKNTGELQRSLVQYQILMEDYPDYDRAYLPFGEVLLDAGEYERALEYLELARLHEPENAYLHYTLGRLHMKQEHWSLALVALRRSEELFPESSETQSLIRECEQALGHVDAPVR